MESDQVSKQLHVDLSVIDEPRGKDPSGLVGWEFTGSSVQRGHKKLISHVCYIFREDVGGNMMCTKKVPAEQLKVI